jgi:hypothetical protein
MFRLNRNKQKTNRNSLIWRIFWYFFRKFRVFPGFFGLFWNVSNYFVSVVLLLYRNKKERKNIYISSFTQYNKFMAAASTSNEIYVITNTHERICVLDAMLGNMYGKGRVGLL